MKKISLLIMLVLTTSCALQFELTEENILANPDKAINVCKGKKESEMFNCLANVGSVLLENKKEEKALAICEVFSDDMKDHCYIEIAKKTNSDKVCAKISGLETRDDCYYMIGKQKKMIEICGNISESNKANDCFYTICSEEEDAEACAKISDEEWKNSELYELALKKKNSSICKKITKQSKADICFYDVAVEIGEAEICKQIISKQKINWCLDEVAKGFIELDIDDAIAACEKMTAGKDNCYWNLVENIVKKDSRKTIEICKRLEIGIDDCLLVITRHWMLIDLDKAEEACKNMSTQRAKNNCVEEIVSRNEAIKLNPDKVFDLCKLDSENDYCYRLAAETLNNLGEKEKVRQACFKMKTAWEKTHCLDKFE